MVNEKVNINQYFLEYVINNKFIFIIYFCLLFVYPIHRVIVPKYYGKLIANLNKGGDKFIKNLKILLFFFILYNVLIAFLHKTQGSLIPRFSQFSVQKIFKSLIKNKNIDYENLQVGEILSKIIKVPNILYLYLDSLRSLIFSQLIISFSTIMYYSTISYKVMITFLFLIIGLVILQFITYNSTLKIELIQEKEKDTIYQHFQDLLNNLITVVVCKQENYENDTLKKKFIPFIQIFEKSLHYNFIFRIIFAIYSVLSFIILNMLLYNEYSSKKISQEKFISSFVVTWSIMSLFTEANYSTRSIVNMYSQIKDMENYFNTNSKFETIINKNENNFDGNIVFENVSYQYKDNILFKGKNNYALKNINLKIESKENTALIGQIGSGKSTIVKLLLKFYEPTSGNIYINNVNLKDISREELYNHIFYIPQKPKLLNRSLYENIFYGMDLKNKDKNLKQLNKIMNEMNLDKNIIEVFMEKMDKPMGNEGVKLSGGQRQMVWIIRSILRNPSIIIFDEPTSALDKENKMNIINTIKYIGKDKTILIITHDSIDSSFRKVLLHQGEIEYEEQDFDGWTT